MNVLVINAGSSSLKYQLLNPATGELLAKGLCERIGIDGRFTYKPQLEGKEAVKEAEVAMPTHSEAIKTVLDALVDAKNGVIASMKEIDAVGHRVVHGGEKFAASVIITDEVMKTIEECNPLAPLHNPANIIGIKACQELMPGVPMVAVFDTATASTAPLTSMFPSAPPTCSASPFPSSSSSPATSATAPPSPRSTAARASTPPWASPRSPVSPWVPAAAISTPASLST